MDLLVNTEDLSCPLFKNATYKALSDYLNTSNVLKDLFSDFSEKQTSELQYIPYNSLVVDYINNLHDDGFVLLNIRIDNDYDCNFSGDAVAMAIKNDLLQESMCGLNIPLSDESVEVQMDSNYETMKIELLQKEIAMDNMKSQLYDALGQLLDFYCKYEKLINA